jgi:hypothetical protein
VLRGCAAIVLQSQRVLRIFQHCSRGFM